MTVTSAVEELDRLQQLYAAGFQDAFLDSALYKIVERQIARDEADLERVNGVLTHFEQQYGLNSEEFWQHFQAGQMPDSTDFVEWNAFCRMRQRIVSRLRLLRGEAHE